MKMPAAHREAGSWLAARDINMVMLSTSLALDGYFSLWQLHADTACN